ncbi:laccase-1-like [Anneissia japonica]|uniref:laccase-1-like n=1 Tax=Anneissia japonica TaxID=1529436 RepID=UPI0014255FFB|nr:laccase-1-like [Anneissia japonica]
MESCKLTCKMMTGLLGLLVLVPHDAAVSSDVCLDDVCYFNLKVRHHRTMTFTDSHGRSSPVSLEDNGNLRLISTWSYTSGSTPNGSLVQPDDVISGDGVVRRIIVINNEFPGPTLEVMEGAKVVVRVTNLMTSEVLSIHWHGLYMTNNVWADGSAYITQCPILPRQSFLYEFTAEPAGTHWYHGHVTTQLADGCYGAIVIHKQPPSTPSRVIMVANWFHEDYIAYDIQSPYRQGWKGVGEVVIEASQRDYSHDGMELNALKYVSALINGKGRFKNNAPLTVFRVSEDDFKFHIINTGGEFAFRISIDCHRLMVVASDGFDVTPSNFQSIIVYPGESYDVLLLRQTKRSCGCRLPNYWLRAETLRWKKGQGGIKDENEVRAIIRYGNSSSGSPTSIKENCKTSKRKCKVLNCPFGGYPVHENTECFSVADLKAKTDEQLSDLLNRHTDEEMFLNVGFNVGSSINCRVFENPRAPFYPYDSRNYDKCDENACNKDNYCMCTNIINLPYNVTVQLVVTDYSFKPWSQSHHPFHLHGYSFAVVKMGFPSYNKTSGQMESPNDDVDCLTRDCCQTHWSNGTTPKLNLRNPPMKNTLVIPSGGYAVIRFRTTNPGWWLFHCHHSSHFMEGMSLLFSVSPENLKDPSGNFNICPDF